MSWESGTDINNRELERKHFLAEFLDFRFNYLDEIPEKKASKYDSKYRFYKCRGTFFFLVSENIDLSIQKGFISSSETLKKIEEFKKYIKGIDFSKRVTKTDIDQANNILDLVIAEMSE